MSTIQWFALFCGLLGVWIVVRKTKSGRTETIWQGKSQKKAKHAILKSIKEKDERITAYTKENDEFGKGDSVITKNKFDDETFYTSGEV